MKKYPFMKMPFWRGDTEEIVAKLSAEARPRTSSPIRGRHRGWRTRHRRQASLSPDYTPMVEAMPETSPRSAQPLDQHPDQLFQHRV